ncbi:tRNA pseudouridine(55) synthase TruB [Ornithinibacillus halotolerans]|uniref:tRNA pseudouridine synthase B n=1 Tax=Ornithinibacillus halotolerans TaxID=1274357 RepID=A0A916RQ29_9BACI|nr:tRNA pseudouridine(55) synthase TruB [Ornithinibacillus halotolerans]GGA62671.1 tRNA pseudouridine synthase B [Ornithinibacillus halotolerans]
MDGILPLWKPKGMTSHDCVMKIRRLFGTRKVGHTGTLDPEVEGVLPICIGQATKIVQFLTETKKIYVAELTLGTSTETEDAYGNIVEEVTVEKIPSLQEIENVLQSFVGEIKQVPPMYSAVKVNGKKLYEYARANETVDRPVRKVFIHDINLLSTEEKSITFRVTCSKGTYIRTLCVDIGEELGYPAHMSFLVREATGEITKEDTITFEEIESASADKRHEFLLPITNGLTHLDTLQVDTETKQKVLNGQKLIKPKIITDTKPFKVMHGERILAIYAVHPNKEQEIKPIRVFSDS